MYIVLYNRGVASTQGKQGRLYKIKRNEYYKIMFLLFSYARYRQIIRKRQMQIHYDEGENTICKTQKPSCDKT